MNLIERMIFEPRGGMFREFVGLTTHFEPKDVSLYRNLLPAQFAMPNQPVVAIFLADYIRVFPYPMTRYQEWSALLKTEWRGEAGWYSVTMPVTSWVAMAGGRYLGFPKFIVEEISLEKNRESFSASAKYKDSTQLALEFHRGLTRPLTSWEKELIENESFFKGNTHQLVPPGRGPRAQKIIIRHVVDPKWSPEIGMMRIEVDPGESWKGLVPDAAEFPGTYNHFIGGFNLIAEKLT
jgi:hypothetical protein